MKNEKIKSITINKNGKITLLTNKKDINKYLKENKINKPIIKHKTKHKKQLGLTFLIDKNKNDFKPKNKIISNRNKVLSNLKKNYNKEIRNKTKLLKSLNENKNNKDNNNKNNENNISIEKYKPFIYNSKKHKHNIRCNFNIGLYNRYKNGNIKNNDLINQFIISKGFCYHLKNDCELKSLDSNLKIITVRLTDLGLTDNLNTFNKPINNYGYPFKRKIYNDTIKNSKDKLELRKNRLYYNKELLENNGYIELYKPYEIINLFGKKTVNKKLLSNRFISKVYRDYLYFLNDNKTKHKFSYHNLKKKQKTVNGNMFLEIFNSLINMIKTNNYYFEKTKNLLLNSNIDKKLKSFIKNNLFFNNNLFDFKDNYVKVYKIVKGKKISIYNKTLNKNDLSLFDKYLSLLMNNKRIFYNNGLYKKQIDVLNYWLNDIKKNAILNYDYDLIRLNGIKLIDKTVIDKDKLNYWLKQNISLIKKSNKVNSIDNKQSKYWITQQNLKQKQIIRCQNRIKEIKQLHKQ